MQALPNNVYTIRPSTILHARLRTAHFNRLKSYAACRTTTVLAHSQGPLGKPMEVTDEMEIIAHGGLLRCRGCFGSCSILFLISAILVLPPGLPSSTNPAPDSRPLRFHLQPPILLFLSSHSICRLTTTVCNPHVVQSHFHTSYPARLSPSPESISPLSMISGTHYLSSSFITRSSTKKEVKRGHTYIVPS